MHLQAPASLRRKKKKLGEWKNKRKKEEPKYLYKLLSQESQKCRAQNSMDGDRINHLFKSQRLQTTVD